MKILVLARLTPGKIRDKLVPLLMCDEVTQVTVIREKPLYLDSNKLRNITYSLSQTDSTPRTNSLQTVWGFLKMARLAIKTIRQDDVDVIYGIYLIPYGLLTWALGKLLRKKSLISMIGTDLNKDVLEYRYGVVLRWILRRVDLITVFDEAARQKLLAHNFDPQKVFVLRHGAEVHRFDRIPDLPQDIDAVFVGYLWALKEVGRLLRAWRLVVDKRPDAQLAIVGDGEQRTELEALSRELGITGNVTFAGSVQNVPEWISRAKIFVNLSNQEGVPMAMVEAMIGGLVPVVTDVGGVPSVVSDGENGFLVENPADPVIVADRILRLLEDEALAETLREKALKIRSEHSYQAVSEWWHPILNTLQHL